MSSEEHVIDLPEDHCIRLLERHHFGRVAVDDGDGPFVVPVNYALVDGEIVFRTDVGTKLYAAVRNADAAFQIDGVDLHRRLGWSVLVRGRIQEVTDPRELNRLRKVPIEPFIGGSQPRYVRVLPSSISGRRIPVPERIPDEWLESPDLGNVWYGPDGTDLLG